MINFVIQCFNLNVYRVPFHELVCKAQPKKNIQKCINSNSICHMICLNIYPILPVSDKFSAMLGYISCALLPLTLLYYIKYI